MIKKKEGIEMKRIRLNMKGKSNLRSHYKNHGYERKDGEDITSLSQGPRTG